MKAKFAETNEVVAGFDIAGFTSMPVRVSSNDVVDTLETYLNTVFRLIDASGGTPMYLNGEAVAGFWPANGVPEMRESIGRALVDILAGVSALMLAGNLPCVPAIGVAFGLTVHTSLEVAGRTLPVAVGPAMNRAMRLSSLCRQMKRTILFPDSLPVIWPGGVNVESMGPVIIKGLAEPLQIMSLVESKG